MTYFLAVSGSLFLIIGICLLFVHRLGLLLARWAGTEEKWKGYYSTPAGKLWLWYFRTSGLLWIFLALLMFAVGFWEPLPRAVLYALLALVVLQLSVRPILALVVTRLAGKANSRGQADGHSAPS